MSKDIALTFILAFLPVLYISIFLHEFGHVVMGRWSGFVVTSFGVGIARPLWVWNWRGTKVFFCRSRWRQALTIWLSPRILPPRRQLVWALTGGVLANGVVALVAFVLWWLLPWGDGVWLAITAINAYMCLTNLIPFTVRFGNAPMRSDGAQILQTLQGREPEAIASARAQMVATLRGLWEAVGDTLGLYTHLLVGALSWADLGDAERAEQLCAEAEAVPLNHSPFTRAYGAVVRGIVSRYAGKIEASAAALDEAEKEFRALNHEAGLLLVALGRAELMLKQEETSRAVESLSTLSAHALFAEYPALPVALVASHLQARADSSDGEEAETLLAAYEAARSRCPSLTRDLWTYSAMARLYVRQQNWAQAETFFWKSLEAVRKLYESFADPAEQTRFLRCHTALLSEAAECLRQLGKDAEKVDALFPSPDELKRQRTAAQGRRSRRYHRVGLLITLVNFISACGMAAAFEENDYAGMMMALLVIYVVLTLLYTLFLFAFSRFMPALRQHGGKVTFILSLMPWLSTVMLIISPPKQMGERRAKKEVAMMNLPQPLFGKEGSFARRWSPDHTEPTD